MRCPNCPEAALSAAEAKPGLTVDLCSACGGVWLDKSELYHFVAAPQALFEQFAAAYKALRPSFSQRAGCGPFSAAAALAWTGHGLAGRLIAVEGLDGSGKSTQLERLKSRLEAEGVKVVVTGWNSSPTVSEALKQAKRERRRSSAGTEGSAASRAGSGRSRRSSLVTSPARDTRPVTRLSRQAAIMRTWRNSSGF